MYSVGAASLAFCRGTWNPETQKYEDDNSLDTMQCCMKKCEGYISFCYDTCKSQNPTEECYQKCDELAQNCSDICLNYPSEGVDIISECSGGLGCGEYPTLDVKCMEKNREKIIDCCHASCLPTMTTNCDEQCQDFYYHLTHGMSENLKKIKNNFKSEISTNVEKKKTKRNYLLFIILFFIVFCIFIFIFLRN